MEIHDRESIKIIADAVKEGRRKRGWSQKQLAAFMGIDPSLVSKWETCRAAPTGEKLFRLAVDLDIVPLLFADYFPKDATPSENCSSVKKEIEWLKQENVRIKEKLHKIESRFLPI